MILLARRTQSTATTNDDIFPYVEITDFPCSLKLMKFVVVNTFENSHTTEESNETFCVLKRIMIC